MLKYRYLLVCLLGFWGSMAFAVDLVNAKSKAASCTGCHGAKGIAIAPIFPNLAGQKEKYLLKAINDYRSKKRVNATMNAIVSTLQDNDAEDLAAYFSNFGAKK